MESLDSRTAVLSVQDLLRDISQWYLRRSRRRFWKGGSDADKNSAYETLFMLLDAVLRILAPLVPFTTEVLFHRVMAAANVEAPCSVHLTRFPHETDFEQDKKLELEMEGLFSVLKAARRLRAECGLRTRQPLREVVVVWRNGEPLFQKALNDLLRDDLNVKKVSYEETTERFLKTIPQLEVSVAGPRFRHALKEVQMQLTRIPEAILKSSKRGSNPIILDNGLEVLPSDWSLRASPKDGWFVAEESSFLVALDGELDESLEYEGLVSDVIRHLQLLRREMGLKISETISLELLTDCPKLLEALDRHRGVLSEEVLATSVSVVERPPQGEPLLSVSGCKVEVRLVPQQAPA